MSLGGGARCDFGDGHDIGKYIILGGMQRMGVLRIGEDNENQGG